MNIPDNLKYTRDHEWIRMEGEVAFAGVTDFAQGELGDIVFVEIETEGEILEKGEVFGTIEAVKTVSDVFMPASGEVAGVNPALADQPELINKDPYGDGWMIRIRLTKPDELDELLSPAEYRDMVNA